MPKTEKEVAKAEEKALEKVGAKALGVFLVDDKGNETLAHNPYTAEVHGDDMLRCAESYKSKLESQGKKAVIKRLA